MIMRIYLKFDENVFDKVKAIVLDPDNQFHVDRQLTKDDVQKLIKVF
jgi:ribosomal protein L19E